jgi:hypothetical protein
MQRALTDNPTVILAEELNCYSLQNKFSASYAATSVFVMYLGTFLKEAFQKLNET